MTEHDHRPHLPAPGPAWSGPPFDWARPDRLAGLSELLHPIGDDQPIPCPSCGTLLSALWALEGARVEDHDGRQHNRARCAQILAEPRGFTWATCPACAVEVHTMLGERDDDQTEIHVGDRWEPHSVHPAPDYILGHFVPPPGAVHRPDDVGLLAALGVWHRWHTPHAPLMAIVAPGTPPYAPSSTPRTETL